LVLKSIAAQRPSMTENDGLPGAPILEIDSCAVFGSNRIHALSLANEAKRATSGFVVFNDHSIDSQYMRRP
jgi:hypothetical protein